MEGGSLRAIGHPSAGQNGLRHDAAAVTCTKVTRQQYGEYARCDGGKAYVVYRRERIERLLSQHGVDYVRGYVDALKDTSSGGSQARGPSH